MIILFDSNYVDEQIIFLGAEKMIFEFSCDLVLLANHFFLILDLDIQTKVFFSKSLLLYEQSIKTH